ncbi:MAG: fibronectin type III domain-containing protein [Oscillospiraceae bacterium]|nr:fibronectin type III domain-containing protein [Oscillospiraceae bacterium]
MKKLMGDKRRAAWLLSLLIWLSFAQPPAPIAAGSVEALSAQEIYLLRTDFDAEPYLSDPAILDSERSLPAGTMGAGGWYVTSSDSGGFSASNYFRITDHSVTPDKRTAEYYCSTSSRQINIDLTEPILPDTGRYGLSFDFELDVSVDGGGFYNIMFANGGYDTAAAPAGNTNLPETGIRIYSGGGIRLGAKTFVNGNIGCNRWYRVNVIIDTDTGQAVWYIHDSEEAFQNAVRDGTGIQTAFPVSEDDPLCAFRIAGMGTSSAGILRIDNLRIFKGETDPESPVFVNDPREIPELPETAFAYSRLGQFVGSDGSSRNFAWQTPASYRGGARLQYIEASGLVGSLFPADGMNTVEAEKLPVIFGQRHSFHASAAGLAPDTEYAYRIGGDGDSWSEIYFFKTLPESGGFGFIAVGDTQMQNSGADAASWNHTVETFSDMFPDAAFLLSAGDQVDAATGEFLYDRYFSPERLPALPIAPTVGNHDCNAPLFVKNYNLPNKGAYAEDGAGPGYYYIYQNALFIHLNLGSYDTPVNETEQEAFIAGAIAAHPDVIWRIVSMHYDIYGSGSNHSNRLYTAEMRRSLFPIFDRNGIDAVFTGHDHSFARSYMMLDDEPLHDQTAAAGNTTVLNPRGTLYMTLSTSTGNKYYNLTSVAQPWVAARKRLEAPSFSYIQISDTSLRIDTYQTDDRELYDSFEIRKGAETEPAEFTVTAVAGPGGTATGGGIFAADTEITLTAIPDTGYDFDGWYEDGIKIPEVGSVYTFEVTADRIVEARFSEMPRPLLTIALDKSALTMKEHQAETAVLTVSFDPPDTTDDRTVIWLSSDDQVAMVENGIVTAKNPGTAAVTAKVGDIEAVCVVTVSEKILIGIRIATPPDKTVYQTGQIFDPAGLTLAAVYDNGSTETVAAGYEYYPDGPLTVHDTIIVIIYGGETADMTITVEKKAGIPGNVSGSGTLGLNDTRMVLQYLVGKINFTDEQLALADVNGDELITVADARLILQYLVGRIPFFPIFRPE